MFGNQINVILSSIDQSIITFILPLSLFFIVFGLDDLFIDFIAWFYQLRPTLLGQHELNQIVNAPEKRIAVILAAWKEEGILQHMVQGNVGSIDYRNYTFFIGVYPNDTGTLREARSLEAQFPNVHVVVNELEGPTCKGQMINQIVRAVFKKEQVEEHQYEGFLIHDSEDVIHPKALKVASWHLSKYDFIQVPVFSLPLPDLSWIAGTYIDEFSEAHTKDMLVRAELGAAIPSAGVGTALSRNLVKTYCFHQDGNLLSDRALTEDYELGVTTQLHHFKSIFVCQYLEAPNSKPNFIATREYFPKSFRTSVRQKSRWTLGIAFQGWENLGWFGNIAQRYFLFRDRKGPFCNFITAFALLIFIYCGMRATQDPFFLEDLSWEGQLVPLFTLNLILMVNRVIQRIICVQRVYGWKTAALSPIRLPLANLVNGLAALRATFQYTEGKLFGIAPKWAKTEHELPMEFGVSLSTNTEMNQETIAG
jgi:bacteriophage N4 adsorption protein B